MKGSSENETEMVSRSPNKLSSSSSITISSQLSSPSVQISTDDEGIGLSGVGLALAGVSMEQDAAYWEWHIESAPSDGDDDDEEDEEEEVGTSLKFGVATKKSPAFYSALEDEQMDDGTQLMKVIPSLRSGDVVAVACQNSDLPMIQFLLNGEPLHELAINRFRGEVYPSIYMQEGYKVTAVFNEDYFKEFSPHVRFGPLIAARGII